MKRYFKRNLIYGILFISLPLLLLAITVGGGLCFDELRQLPNSGWLLFRDDAEKELAIPGSTFRGKLVTDSQYESVELLLSNHVDNYVHRVGGKKGHTVIGMYDFNRDGLPDLYLFSSSRWPEQGVWLAPDFRREDFPMGWRYQAVRFLAAANLAMPFLALIALICFLWGINIIFLEKEIGKNFCYLNAVLLLIALVGFLIFCSRQFSTQYQPNSSPVYSSSNNAMEADAAKPEVKL